MYFLLSLWDIIATFSSESLFLHYYPSVFSDIITCSPCGSCPHVIREISPPRKSTKLDMTPLNHFSMLWGGVHRNHCLTPCQNLETTVNYQSLMSWLSSCASHTSPYDEQYQQTNPLLQEECCSSSTTALYQHLPDDIGRNSSFEFPQTPWRVKIWRMLTDDTPRWQERHVAVGPRSRLLLTCSCLWTAANCIHLFNLGDNVWRGPSATSVLFFLTVISSLV